MWTVQAILHSYYTGMMYPAVVTHLTNLHILLIDQAICVHHLHEQLVDKLYSINNA